MDFIDLAAQQRRIYEKVQTNIARVLSHGQYINGPEVRELETALAGYVGRRHAVGCASGTDALLMALMALDIGPGDAVFTTPFTFVATAEVITLLGATPVFVDIDAATFNIDPAKLDRAIEAVEKNDPTIHPLPRAAGERLRPRAVIPVDLFGLPADYETIEAIAARRGIAVIEDAAQSFGGEYKGRKACSFGEIACTSFFPAKPLGCYGDGGMIFTDDGPTAEILRSIRVHGQGSDKYENVRIGINGRLDTLQAAVLMAKFSIFPEEIELRQKVAREYGDLLSHVVTVPGIPKGYKSAWAQYSICARDSAERTALMVKLKGAGVPTAIYYPKPLHRQTAFACLTYRQGDFPVSEACAGRIFSLPMHPYLAAAEQRRIAGLFA
ncbi:MAG: DegT/DnrJ/EryC1/StrS family aminotransferase [Deltaproteobacteria bacterium]|nr:DegT/DnrJ/EryC1/StrS family aminotransferase [Deltaproteobacteria bacterium]